MIRNTDATHIYLLKDLASLTGHSIHTVKYYLKLDLLQSCGRSPTTGIRYFNKEALERLNTIRAYRKKNMSLKSIQQELLS